MKACTVKFVCAAQLSLMVDEDSYGCAVVRSPCRIALFHYLKQSKSYAKKINADICDKSQSQLLNPFGKVSCMRLFC